MALAFCAGASVDDAVGEVAGKVEGDVGAVEDGTVVRAEGAANGEVAAIGAMPRSNAETNRLSTTLVNVRLLAHIWRHGCLPLQQGQKTLAPWACALITAYNVSGFSL